MSEYKGIKGFQVQTRTEDPTPYAQALEIILMQDHGLSGGNLNTARKHFRWCRTQTAGLGFWWRKLEHN